MWQIAGNREQQGLLDFVTRDEWRCVPLSARLLRSTRFPLQASEPTTTLVCVERGQRRPEVTAAVMLTRSGMVLPVLDRQERLEFAPGDRLRVILDRFEGRLHSIMGMKPCVHKSELAFRRRPFVSIDYHLMVLDLRGWEPRALPELPTATVRKAMPEDTDALFPLQRSYELEEVYLDPRQFDDGRCRSLLRRALREELVYVAEIGGVPVAKAGTNARGYTTDQIGGVFTRRDLRGRGLARLVMAGLLREIAARKTHACLFVKKHNEPAIRLYQALDFEIRGEYRISYYGRV